MYLRRRQPLFVFALISCIVFTACPAGSESQLDKVVKATHTVSVRYPDVVTFVADLYKGGAISLQVKDRIADILIQFGKKGEAFNSLLATLSAQYKDGKVPGAVWSVISKNFDELSADFLKIIDFVPQAAGLAGSTAFRAISAAIMILANVLITTGFKINRSQFDRIKEGVAAYGLA